jgi:hypothetical protein
MKLMSSASLEFCKKKNTATCFTLVSCLFFDVESGGDIFLRNVSQLSADYIAYYPRRWNSSFLTLIFYISYSRATNKMILKLLKRKFPSKCSGCPTWKLDYIHLKVMVKASTVSTRSWGCCFCYSLFMFYVCHGTAAPLVMGPLLCPAGEIWSHPCHPYGGRSQPPVAQMIVESPSTR